MVCFYHPNLDGTTYTPYWTTDDEKVPACKHDINSSSYFRMALLQVRASHVNTPLIHCEIETKILHGFELISLDSTLKNAYFFQMKACRMFLVVPTVGIRGNFIIEFLFCFISLCLEAQLPESIFCPPYNLKTNIFEMPGLSNVDNFVYGPVRIVHQKPSDEYYLTNVLNLIFSNLFLICNFAKLSLIVYANKGI